MRLSQFKQITFFDSGPFKKRFSLKNQLENQLEKMLVLKMTLASVTYMMDFVKDSLILVELSFSQGGITLLMTQFNVVHQRSKRFL